APWPARAAGPAVPVWRGRGTCARARAPARRRAPGWPRAGLARPRRGAAVCQSTGAPGPRTPAPRDAIPIAESSRGRCRRRLRGSCRAAPEDGVRKPLRAPQPPSDFLDVGFFFHLIERQAVGQFGRLQHAGNAIDGFERLDFVAVGGLELLELPRL